MNIVAPSSASLETVEMLAGSGDSSKRKERRMLEIKHI
jgi:hypothetical protein